MALRDDGFAVLRGVLPRDAIDAHLDAVEPVIYAALAEERRAIDAEADESDAAVYCRSPRPVLTRAKEATRQSEAGQTLFYDPVLRTLALEHFAAEPVFCNGSTVLFPTGRPPDALSLPHADYLSAAAPDPWTNGLRFWCALEDIDDDSGPFQIWRGSHRLVSHQVQDELLRDDPALAAAVRRQLDLTGEAWRPIMADLHRKSCAMMAERCDRLELEPVRFVIRKGDVVAFNPATVHGPSACRNDRLTRKTMIFDVCRPNAPFYPARVYWGPRHDYRSPENRMPIVVEQGPRGPRWADYPALYEAQMARAVVH